MNRVVIGSGLQDQHILDTLRLGKTLEVLLKLCGSHQIEYVHIILGHL